VLSQAARVGEGGEHVGLLGGGAQVVVWLLVGALVFVGLAVSFFLLTVVFPD